MENKRIIWKPEVRKLKDLTPFERSDKRNPRIIEDHGLAQLGESFDEIGYCEPIAINRDEKNTILSGHARWMQLSKENPDGEVLVMVPDRLLTPKQEEAVIIRMNKNIAGKWDFVELIENYDLDDLEKWGFKPEELPNYEKLGMDDNLENSSQELSEGDFQKFDHQCPKCGFEWNNA